MIIITAIKHAHNFSCKYLRFIRHLTILLLHLMMMNYIWELLLHTFKFISYAIPSSSGPTQ